MKRAMAVALLLVAVACGGSDSDGAAGADEPSAGDEAVDVCRQSVEGKLKAPATAEFSDETTEQLDSHGDRFEVQGRVDAENGFGALIRMVWKCDARLLSDGSWSVETQISD